jgi:hypothetical protein
MNRLLIALLAALAAGALALFAWLATSEPESGPVAAPDGLDAAERSGAAVEPALGGAPPALVRRPADEQPFAASDRDPAAGTERDAALASAGAGQSLGGKLVGPFGDLGGGSLVLRDSAGGVLARGASRADGTFLLALATPCADAQLTVSAEACAPFANGPWRIAAGERRFAGVIRLEAALRLAGRVVAADGAPVAGARVLLRAGSATRPANLHVQSTESGPDGAFEFAAAPESPVRLEAWSAGHGARALDAAHGPGSKPLVLTLGKAHRLAARVRSVDGAALSGAKVTLVSTARDVPGIELATDAAGLASAEGLGAAHFGLRAEAHGFRPEVLGSAPADGREIPLALKPWPSIRGRLEAAPGVAVAEAVVRALAVDHEGRAIQATSSAVEHAVAPDGSFVIDDLRPGFYCVEAESRGFAPCRSGSVQLLLDRPPPFVALVLSAGATLALAVHADGAALAGATVEAHDLELSSAELWRGTSPQRRALAVAASDRAGRAVLEHLPKGATWIVVRASDRLSTIVGPYQLDGGESRDIGSVDLAHGAGLAGIVVDARGQAVAGASVVLVGTSAPRATAHVTSDAVGRFASPRLPEGPYRASARESGRSASRECWLAEGEDVEIRLELR